MILALETGALSLQHITNLYSSEQIFLIVGLSMFTSTTNIQHYVASISIN